MKKAVLKFTACCLAVGMTFTGSGSLASAATDTVLVGFDFASVQGSTDTQSETQAEVPQQTVAPVETSVEETSAPETQAETAEETSAPAEETEAPVQTEAPVETEAPVQTETPVETEAPETEPVADTSMAGQIAFAQCDEYINIRSGASTDSEVVGKVYNNGSVTILSQLGDWYEVQSGNAVGFVNAAYFAIGAQAEAIAEEVAYNVATVYPEALMIRSQPSEESDSIGMAYSSDELEVVAYEGDWMKVALGNDVYGYINAYYVDYDTYYATAETLEEEQARLDAEWLAYLAEQEAERLAAEQAYLEAIAAEEAAAAAAQAAADAAYQAQISAQSQVSSSGSAATQDAANAAYEKYLAAQAEADAATQQADEQLVYDTAEKAQAAYQEFLSIQNAADAASQAAADAAAQQAAADAAAQQAAADAAAQAAADAAAQAAADAAAQAAQQQAAAEQAAQEQASQEQSSSSSSSSLGSQIVNFATQFVGNPYVWGGTSLTNGADCSGFTQSVMANFGISIPRTAASQSGSGRSVSLSEIQPGDLLFYSGGGGINHVTIYMGGGQVVHASSSTTGIIISSYGYRTPVSARRYW